MIVKGHRDHNNAGVLRIASECFGHTYNLNLHSDNKVFGSVTDIHLLFELLYDLIIVVIIDLEGFPNIELGIRVLILGLGNLFESSLGHRELILGGSVNNLGMSRDTVCIHIVDIGSANLKEIVDIDLYDGSNLGGVRVIGGNPKISVLIGVLREFLKVLAVEGCALGNLNAILNAAGLRVIDVALLAHLVVSYKKSRDHHHNNRQGNAVN